MKELFKDIQDRLTSEVPELAMIDFDLGQLEQEPLPSLSYPAVLLSFGESQFSDLGGFNEQEALVMLTLRVVFRTYERTHSIASEEYRNVGLAHLDILDKVKWALNGFEGDNFNSISQKTLATEPRADLRVYSLTFETLATFSPPNPQYLPINSIVVNEQTDERLNPTLCIKNEDDISLL